MKNVDTTRPSLMASGQRDTESINDPRLAESLNGQQQSRLYGFFTVIPKTCESAAKALTKNGKEGEGHNMKRKANSP